MTTAESHPWLVSRRFDLGMFLAPAAIALLLVALAPVIAPSGETPIPLWVFCVLVVDVAHVWSTLYRTYLDRTELRRRPLLYAVVPVAAYAGGVLFASLSFALFWTALAYLAVWHFVRQQAGWIALYDRRDPRLSPWERRIDVAAIYAATLFPILWWHAHLPLRFEWFLPGDFIDGIVPDGFVTMLVPLYVLALGAFVVRQALRGLSGDWRTGKIIVVITTALCWGIGIVVTNSDYAFTVTNVLIHGVPYFGIVWIYGRRTRPTPDGTFVGFVFSGARLLPFLGVVVALAYLEELGWDRLVWHQGQGVFFGPALTLSENAIAAVMPLLAVPQVTHYILDGFIWRTRPAENPQLASVLAQR